MSNFKKLLLVTASTLAITTSSIAANKKVKTSTLPVVSDLQINISAYTDFQAGLRKQSKLSGDEKNVSNHRQGFAFYNSSAMAAKISNKVNDVEYGAKIVLVPTTKRKGGPSFDGSHMYVQSDYGRFEGGSPLPASSAMMIDSGEVTAGAGNWGRYAHSSIDHLKQNTQDAPSFATSSDFFLDDKLTTDLDKRAYTSEPARSVGYYTPKFALTESTKVQVGLSYVPDSSNTGADNPSTDSGGTVTSEITDGKTADEIYKFEIDQTVKNAFGGGLTIEQNLSDGVDLKLALTGEAGKSAGSITQYKTAAALGNDPVLTKYKLKDLRTYNIGAALNVGSFSYAGSYGSLGKSLTSKEFHKTGRNTSYYTGAVAYKQGPFAASVSYFKSDRFKNTVEEITVGTDYQLAPGFKPYAEITRFDLKGKHEFNRDIANKKTRGTVALIGAKLSL